VRKSLGTTGGLVAILASLAVVPAAWAGNFYLYEDNGFEGHRATFEHSDAELSNRYWDGTNIIMQNKASSMINHRSSPVGLWNIGTSCTGDNYIAQADSHDGSLGSNGFNDEASCVVFL
jgi:hypothetical protein